MRSPDPEETNPCDPDTDRDSNPGSVNAFGAAGGNSSDAEERQRGTNPLDFDGLEDDQLWLEDPDGDGVADAVALDVNSNGQVDARIEVIPLRDLAQGDFDEDGAADDCRYIVVYALSNYRALQPRVVLTIYDFNCDLVIDQISLD